MQRARRRARSLATLLTSLFVCLQPLLAVANPAGGAVQSGSATISGQGTPVVNVNQQSSTAVLSWQSFNIKPGETTNFHQPGTDAVAINRIFDQNASAIFGALNANGNVYLINPNGILFAPGSQVNVGGLAAATSYRAGQKMIEGGFDPSATSARDAAIVNQGTIRARDGGFIYLVAPRVENGSNGVIVAPGGEVSIAAGATVRLTDRPDGRGVQIEYTAPGKAGEDATALAGVLADASFASLRLGALRQAGVVEANAVRERNGKIELYAASELELASGSRSAATGGEGHADGGTVRALSDQDSVVAEGAVVDVSGGKQGGKGGFIEVSAKRRADLSGTFRAPGTGGAQGGEVLIDPEVAEVGSQQIIGARNVKVTADKTIRLTDGATVSLESPQGKPTYALHSGGDIVFGTGATITDAASPGTTDAHWNVQLVAGATDLSPDGLALGVKSDPNAGGIYLGDGTGSTGDLQPGTGSGRVSLTAGDIVTRASGDLWIGNDGGLQNQEGKIDVEVGRDVRFSAGSTTTDGVIENGSGSIRVVAGNSVILSGRDALGNLVDGNAAIRTRGRLGHVEQNTAGCNSFEGCDTRTEGGHIFVQAVRGDVDAGIGNRWLTLGGTDPDDFDPMPVFRDGILGIGTEAGGDVMVIAGRDVKTGDSARPRSGGSASGLLYTPFVNGYGYDGGHIGVFGVPSLMDLDNNSNLRSKPFGVAPSSTLSVVAGRNIMGDYMARSGKALLLAGYDAVVSRSSDGKSSVEVTPSQAALAYPDPATGGSEAGYVGTFDRPVTVDLIRASAQVRGQNGVVLRAIENPSLVYQPASVDVGGTFRVPSYGPDDGAEIEAVTGDVVLLGSDSRLPMPTTDPRMLEGGQSVSSEDNPLVRLLPPKVRIKTNAFSRAGESRGGDLVLLEDFVLFPSPLGGLQLDVAGKVRTANGTAATSAELELEITTVGAAKEREITLPLGTRLVDPSTPGLEYVLTGTGAIRIARRLDAQAAMGKVVFQTSRATSGEIFIPKGTRVAGINGQIYETVATTIQAPAQRTAAGEVLFTGESGAVIPEKTRFVAPDGTIFRTVGDATITAGRTTVSVKVVADVAGHDARALSLRLLDNVPRIYSATNFQSVSRPTSFEVDITAAKTGLAGNTTARSVPALLDPIAGIESIVNLLPIGGGAEIATQSSFTGTPAPRAVALVQGPVGATVAGRQLRLKDPSVLPAGVSADEILLTATRAVEPGALLPSIYRRPSGSRGGSISSTRPDPDATTVVSVSPSDVWQRSGIGNSATLQQSDAAPEFDGRISGVRFDYDRYYRFCHSGAACTAVPDPQSGSGQALLTGSGPTHSGDPTPASLQAQGGFERVRFDLAQPALLTTQGDVKDVALLVQHSTSSDLTELRAPRGNASFGAGVVQLVDRQLGRDIPVTVADDPTTGLQVAGPGSGRVLVGVESFDEADSNHDGVITRNEFAGSDALFDVLDRQNDFLPNGSLTRTDAPYVPTGAGGTLALAGANASTSVAALGVESIGNTRNPALPANGAALKVVTAADVRLNDRGSIGSLQGGPIDVWSIGGSVLGGSPPEDTTEKRGIYSLNTPSGLTSSLTDPLSSGGGSISVVAFGEINPGRSAIAALSGGKITLASLDGSVNAGFGEPFESPMVQLDPNTGLPRVTYEGAGIAALGGTVEIRAKRNVNIGAGITGAGITIDAGGSITAGTGAIQSSGNVNLNAGGTIGGTISAGGSVSIGSGTVSQTASVSAGGIVAGGGAAVSNAGGAKSSAETNKAADTVTGRADSLGGVGGGSGSGPRGPRKGVIIDVSLKPCENEASCGV